MAVTSASYDAANRLTSRTASGTTQTPTWDANGSLTSDGVNPFTWDARNRLIAIGTSGSVGSFVYDGLNRRQTATLNGASTSYLYSGDDVVQELQSGSVTASELIGLAIDERLSRAGETYLTDLLGSTVALASGTSIQTSYGYDPYGVAQTPVGASSTNPFQFTGREKDATSAGLMYYRARYYNPSWGRFVSEDPIGINGGINLYAYVEGNPSGYNDPSGLTAAGGLAGMGPGAWIGGVIGGLIDPLGGEVPGALIGRALGAAIGDWATGPDTWCSKTPNEGEPGSTHINPGSGQERKYGPDGKPEHDIDWDHDHGQGVPHAHNWDGNNRGPGYPVSPWPQGRSRGQ